MLSPSLVLQKVTDAFTPEVLGAFWITDKELSGDLPGFHAFNYLFDGLLSQYLFGLEDKVLLRSNIFFTKNFNHQIFLAHIKMDSDMHSALDEQIALIQENSGARKKVLIFNQTKDDWKGRLEKRYPKFEFVELELE
jgi:hypothetical protein